MASAALLEVRTGVLCEPQMKYERLRDRGRKPEHNEPARDALPSLHEKLNVFIQ